MWSHRYINRIDLRFILIILCLMGISLLVLSSMTLDDDKLLTSVVKSQIQWFGIGWIVFFFCAGLDYRKLREWTWILYALMILLLVGLYFTTPIQNVHRWYRIPGLSLSLQPSEYAKLVVVLSLGWMIEKRAERAASLFTIFQLGLIVGIPFLLILKQPDLGTALVLYPITLVMCYFGSVHRIFFRILAYMGLILLLFVTFFYSNLISHEKMRPYFTQVLKEYQYERLNPNTYHQKAAQTAIAIGGVWGSGWHKSEFSSHGWLPAAHTDSVFSAYAEEFGFVGVLILLALFYALIHLSFKTASVAKDSYGRLLASGLAVYLAMHIMVNIAMMCGFLPISGVPLVLVTYGGSSILATMAALGVLSSIYSRRFMF